MQQRRSLLQSVMRKKISALALPLFALWPFGAFLLSLLDIKSKSSALVFVLFSALFGYAFNFEFQSADSYRVALVFNEFELSSLNDIIVLYKSGGMTDLYRNMMYGITKQFSNNPKVLFMLFGLVFGVINYYALRVIIREKDERYGIILSVIVFIFFVSNPITNINGARFWTATSLFFLASMNFLFYKNKRWLIGILLCPMIHFSYILPLIITLVFYFLQPLFYSSSKVRRWLIVAFFSSFILSFVLDTNAVNVNFLNDSSLIPHSIARKIDIYTSEEVTIAVKERRDSLFLTVSRLFSYSKRVFFFIFLLFIISKSKKYIMPNEYITKLLSFIIFFLTISYLLSFIPSVARFVYVGFSFVLVLFIRIYHFFPDSNMKRFILILLPVYALDIFFDSAYLPTLLVSPTVWYGNFFWIISEGIGYEFVY